MLLSDKAAAGGCDGGYTLAHDAVVDSLRPHLGAANNCPPYPSWPSQSTAADGDGVAGLLATSCPGAAEGTPSVCSSSAGCGAAAGSCPPGAAVACVTKSCEGRYMVGSMVTPVEACTRIYVSQVTGLPVAACNATALQLARQSKQQKRRTDLAAGRGLPPAVNAKTGRQRLAPPEALFGSRFGGSGGGR